MLDIERSGLIVFGPVVQFDKIKQFFDCEEGAF
jgi:hypothetical protein